MSAEESLFSGGGGHSGESPSLPIVPPIPAESQALKNSPPEAKLAPLEARCAALERELAREAAARQAAEEALAKNETRWKAVFAQAPFAICIKRLRDHTYLEVNPEFERFYGYPASEIVGQTMDLLTPAGFKPQIENTARQLEQHGHFENQEIVIQTKAGVQRHAICSAKTCYLGSTACYVSITVDITERKLMELALRESDRNYRAIFNAPNEAIFVHDARTGVMLDVNDAALGMYGVSRAEAPRLTPAEISFGESPYSGAEARAWLAKAAAEGPQIFEWRSRKKTGELFWVEVSLKRIELEGQPRILAMVRNIEERKQAESAMRESEAILASLFRSLPVGVALSVRRVIQKVNHALCRILGYAEEELAGQASRLIYDDETECERVGREFYASTGRDALRMVEARLRRKDGRVIHVLMGASPFYPDDWNGGVAVAFLDITERKQFEDEVDRLQALLLAAMEQTPAGLIIADAPDIRFRLANSTALDILGCDRDSIINVPMAVHSQGYQVLRPNGEAMAFEDLPLTRTITQGETTANVELMIRRPDGETRWILSNTAPVRDRQGRIVAGVAVFPDVTNLKKAEAAKASLQAQLRQTQKLEAIGTLAGGIAHDFNNLLGAMMGYAALAREECQASPEAREDIGRVLEACDRAKHLVQQILSFSRQAKQERKPLQLHLVINEALKLLRSSLPATIEMVTDIPHNLPPVVADPTQIHQILMNLCTNAAHAMQGAVGRLEVNLEAATPDAEFCQTHAGLAPGHYVRLSVKDTGHGMDEPTLQRIFDPFFTTKSPGEGTGLGLSVVHGIVKEHEGAIFAQSQPGRGAQFQVYFPALKDNPAQQSQAPSRVYPGHQERILVVDDESALCNALSRLLTKLNYQPLAFDHPHTALAAFRENPQKFDLVITDLTMPTMTGVDLARELLSIRPGLPIILASGFSGACAPEAVHTAGFFDLIAKPFDVPQMSAVIRRALRKTGPKA